MIEEVRSIAMWQSRPLFGLQPGEDCAAYNGGMHMRQGREPRMNGDAGAGSP